MSRTYMEIIYESTRGVIELRPETWTYEVEFGIAYFLQHMFFFGAS